MTNYQEGVQQYAQGNYETAARLFKKALQFRTNHTRCQELYRNSLARAQGRNPKMTTEVKAQYSRGLQLYSDGRYQEALDVWEAVLEKDPLNIRILEAIEGAKKKLNIYNRK